MGLKIKLLALVLISSGFVVMSACKGGGEQAKQKADEVCNQAQRICKDGSAAIRDDATSCYQKCPEDTITVSFTNTVTNTDTVTTTQTSN